VSSDGVYTIKKKKKKNRRKKKKKRNISRLCFRNPTPRAKGQVVTG